MKKLILLCCIFFSLKNIRAAVFTVSNSNAWPAQYSTIADGIAAASPGDTVYVYATGIWYGEFLALEKKLTMIGGGSQTQGGAWTGVINAGVGGGGSVISGFGFAYPLVINSNNVAVTDCQINTTGGIMSVSGNNFLLENCILYTHVRFWQYGQANIVVRNNLVYAGFSIRPGTTGIFNNNVFSSANAGEGCFDYIQGGEGYGNGLTISNNIFYKKSPYHPALNDCSFINNIYFLTGGNVPPVNGGSSGNIEADPQFENYPAAGASSFDLNHSYKLLASSPGHNYGTDGSDIGAWGGQNPMNAIFFAPVPRVYSITTSNNTVPPGGQMQITIKATKAQ